ncbi:cutinase transcription factor 1 alpha [Fusarium pseudocircinatum]|uniref:Cutinase transcription factor 1 alpha n=1 Tax=Fusarium pseudocircinatum TaxID=56676 RepID=A0A8H5KNI2_9HYPO|nr:cutinase transcription factor 1 alpha [Fusarium pseudocircinatum]
MRKNTLAYHGDFEVISYNSLTAGTIESRRGWTEGLEDEETVFLGESTYITNLHSAQPSPASCPSSEQRMFYRVPEAWNARNLTSQWEIERNEARLRLLQVEGAFSFPTKSAIHRVLMAYFRWLHICFAVVDEPDIWNHIYIRERQCSAALGVPNRVRDEDCDIEALSEDDFQYAFDASSPSARKNESTHYTSGST